MNDKAALQHHQTAARSEVSAFDLVRMEYEQLRQDERQHTAVSVALVAVIITVLAAMTTVFVVVDRSRVSVPSWLYLITPIIPCGLFAIIASYSVTRALRGEFMVRIEDYMNKNWPVHIEEFPIPSTAHWTRQALAHGPTRFLWKIVRIAVLVLFASMIGFPILAVGSLWIFNPWVMRTVMIVIYGATFLFIAGYYLVLGGIRLSDRATRSRFRGRRLDGT